MRPADAGSGLCAGVGALKPDSRNLAEQVGANIFRMRREAGLTQQELSRLTYIRQSDLSRLELGHYSPHLATLVKLARGLEVSAADFLQGIR
jgi:transcriptional regulator with XRE-family HTH domain